MIFLSPVFLMIVTWMLCIVVAVGAAIFSDSLSIVRLFSSLSGIYNQDHISARSLLWLAASLGVFLIAAVMGQMHRPFVGNRLRLDFTSAARQVGIIHVSLLIITLLWIGMVILQLGSLERLIVIARYETNAARDILLENKLFFGMRLVYTGFIATATFAATLLGINSRTEILTTTQRRICFAILLSSLAIYAVMPIVMSQRILLFIVLISCYTGASIGRGSLVGYGYLPIVAGLLAFITWATREYFVFGHMAPNASPADIGFQKLIFYFVNDFYNANYPITFWPGGHTMGLLLLDGISRVTLTNGWLNSLRTSDMLTVESVRAGGTLPLFTEPFVDFGVFGLVVIAVLGWILGRLFCLARQNPRYAAIYGLLVPGIPLSLHFFYYGHHNFIFNLFILLYLISRIHSEPVRSASSPGSLASTEGSRAQKV